METIIYEDVVKCDSNTKISEVAKQIHEHNVKHLFVIEGKKLVGVVGGIDITNKVVAEGKDPNNVTAKDVMNKVEAVAKDQKIEFAYAIMRNFNTFICPVVDENKHLIGYYKFAEVCDAINAKIRG